MRFLVGEERLQAVGGERREGRRAAVSIQWVVVPGGIVMSGGLIGSVEMSVGNMQGPMERTSPGTPTLQGALGVPHSSSGPQTWLVGKSGPCSCGFSLTPTPPMGLWLEPLVGGKVPAQRMPEPP